MPETDDLHTLILHALTTELCPKHTQAHAHAHAGTHAFEIRSHYTVQAGLEFVILLSGPLECWRYKCLLPLGSGGEHL